jgi:hypothetical protein
LAAREALDRCGGIATSALVSTSRKVKRKQILYNFPKENKKTEMDLMHLLRAREGGGPHGLDAQGRHHFQRYGCCTTKAVILFYLFLNIK